MLQLGSLWKGMLQLGSLWKGMLQLGTLWKGMLQLGSLWKGMLQLESLWNESSLITSMLWLGVFQVLFRFVAAVSYLQVLVHMARAFLNSLVKSTFQEKMKILPQNPETSRRVGVVSCRFLGKSVLSETGIIQNVFLSFSVNKTAYQCQDSDATLKVSQSHICLDDVKKGHSAR